MDINALSNNFFVRKLNQDDLDIIYDLSIENRTFYQYHPPIVTKESILDDMIALPPNKTMQDKYYIGFFDNNTLVAVMDLIDGYPTEKVVFLGFFMVNVKYQKRGVGSGIIRDVVSYLKELNFEKIRLAVDKENPQSNAFWNKNKFVVVSEAEYRVMELML